MNIKTEMLELSVVIARASDPVDHKGYWKYQRRILTILEKLNERQQQHASLIISHDHSQPQAELKPCANCGSTFNRTDRVVIDFCISCSGCGMNTGHCKSIVEAREVWQRRSI